jgi:hypothetical protein
MFKDKFEKMAVIFFPKAFFDELKLVSWRSFKQCQAGWLSRGDLENLYNCWQGLKKK